MQQLPKIVKERLATPGLSGHPDADMLTAFAEQSLPGSDRVLIMEHIARCGDCREVLALALPEMEEAVAPVTWQRPWFSMPVLRWGAIAAACVVLVSVGVVRYRQGSPQMTAEVKIPKESTFNTASNTSNEPAIPSTKSEIPPPPNPASIAGADKPSPMTSLSRPGDTAARADVNTVREKTNSDALVASVSALAGSASKNEPQQPTADASSFAARVRPVAPASTQTETLKAANASPAALPEQSQLASQQTENVEQTEQQANSSEVRTVVGKAKAPIAAPAMGSPGLARSSAPFSMTPATEASAPGPRWTITSAGGLQRSYDEGKTWQDVSVTANPVSAKVTLQAEPSALSAQNVPQLKKQKDSVASPIIRAISASSSEIWAGAAGGVVYHSSDAGNHWTSIIPSDNGVLLTGDIVSLQFSDASHGKITTSTSEIWTTTDGQHWSKQ
jgi:hypothetical protein